jgi:hypothetical protein
MDPEDHDLFSVDQGPAGKQPYQVIGGEIRAHD